MLYSRKFDAYDVKISRHPVAVQQKIKSLYFECTLLYIFAIIVDNNN